MLSSAGSPNQVVYRTTPYRWLIMFILFNQTICGAAVGICLSSISTSVAQGFHVSINTVNACAIIVTAVYIPMSFIAIKLYTVFRPSNVLRLGSLFVLVGGWTRAAVGPGNFWPAIVGNGIMSASGPILLSTVTPICNRWFGN